MQKLFGLSALHLMGTLLIAGVVWHVVGLLASLLAVFVISAAVHYRAIKALRPEAAWEMTEHGTRQLWNDGPKWPTRRFIKRQG